MWTKEAFLEAASVTPGNFRVYLESTISNGASVIDRTDIKGHFYMAAAPMKDGRAFIVGFGSDKRQEAEAFAAFCRKQEEFRVVEGPQLVSQ